MRKDQVRDMIDISYSTNNMVRVFSHNGNWLITIDGTGSGDTCVMETALPSLITKDRRSTQ